MELRVMGMYGSVWWRMKTAPRSFMFLSNQWLFLGYNLTPFRKLLWQTFLSQERWFHNVDLVGLRNISTQTGEMVGTQSSDKWLSRQSFLLVDLNSAQAHLNIFCNFAPFCFVLVSELEYGRWNKAVTVKINFSCFEWFKEK